MTGFYKGYSNSNSADNKQHWVLGAPSNPMIAKQLDEFNKLLNQGIKNIEIGTISADKFEQIPREHFDEVRRLAKLTDAKPSVHAPLLDLAGFQENRWREDQRASTEQQVFSILDRASKLSVEKEENGKKVIEAVPVVFHAGNVFSQEYGVPYDPIKHKDGLYKEEYIMEDGKYKIGEDGKPLTRKEPTEIKTMMAINQETGEIRPLIHEKKYRLGEKEPEIYDADKKLRSLNVNEWDQEKLKILNYQKEIEELREKMELKLKQNDAIKKTDLIEDNGYKRMFQNNELEINRMGSHIREIDKLLTSDYENLYHKFKKFSSPTRPEDEKKEDDERLQKVNEIQKKLYKEIREKYKQLQKIKDDEQSSEEAEKLSKEISDLSMLRTKQIVTGLSQLSEPELWKPVGKFAIEKTSDTIAGAMTRLYEKLKKEGKEKELPLIAIENFFVNTPMSRADDLKEAVELSRKKLAEKLKEKCNLSEKEATDKAKQLVGATWDVGHINNLRKAGYEGDELKEKMIEEAKKIADVTKHVHITDNFGFFDSHLAPGMGNVPIREVMEELEKVWAKQHDIALKEGRPFQAPRGIVEAGGLVGEIGQNPTIGILEYFNSPLFKMSPSPYWGGGGGRGIAHSYSPYLEPFMEFPSQHFNLYGSSFTTLPKSVGGQVGGESSRFSGTPNQ